MAYKIVITCDRTLASDYHGLMFFGFSACLPSGTLPDWLFYPLFCPNGKHDTEGRLLHANCGMRKIEAALLADGFNRNDIVVAHPDCLDKVIGPETEIVSISSNDPLGIGPATSTYSELWGGEGRMAIQLRRLLRDPAIKKHKPFIVLGGPGAWQLGVNPEKRQQLGVDCAFVGEGELSGPKLFRRILADGRKDIPTVVNGDAVPVDQIPDIVGGTTIGITEVTRGCARSCAFCVPSVRSVRSRGLESILREVQVNIDAGNTGVILHGEDVLLYRSDGLKVNGDAVVEMFERVYTAPGVRFVGASHAALSSAVSSPQTIERLARVLELGTEKNPINYFQVGIETASPKLIGRHMKGKVYPFTPDQWPQVVLDGFKLFSEHHFVGCATVIMGLPGEEKEDIEQTTELMKNLRPYQSMVVPLLFSPLQTTRLEYATPLKKKDLMPQHYELIAACWDHNFAWLPSLWANYGKNKNPILKAAIGVVLTYGAKWVKHQIHRDAIRHGARI